VYRILTARIFQFKDFLAAKDH